MEMKAASIGRSKSVIKAITVQPRDMDRMLRKLDMIFRKYERRLFSTEGASGGRKWKALSPAYAKWKRRHARGRKIMVLGKREGKSLRKSLTMVGGDHTARWTISLTGGIPTFFLGTQDILAAWHINPAVLGIVNDAYNPNMPHRDTLQMKPAQRNELLKVLSDYYTKVIMPRFHRAMISAMKRKVAALNRRGMPKKGK